MATRRAIIKLRGKESDMRRQSWEEIERYLPANYQVAVFFEHEQTAREFLLENGDRYTIIEGQDEAGWTLTEYVIPRLASGLISATEIPA